MNETTYRLINQDAVLEQIDRIREALIKLNMYGAEDVLVRYARRIVEELPSVKWHDIYMAGYGDGYQKAERDYYKKHEKDFENTFNAGYEIAKNKYCHDTEVEES